MTDTDPTLDPDLTDSDDSADSDDGQEDDPIAALRAELDERDARLNAALANFSATVGRLQSLANKPAKDTSAAEREEYTQAFQLIDQLIDGLDETSLSPEKRRQIEATREAARRKAETSKLKADLKKEVLAEFETDDAPDEQAKYLAEVRAFEDGIIEEITSYGLRPEDFDWKQATEILIAKGQPATRAYFRAQIKEAMAKDQSETRLQTRKTGAKAAPKAAGAAGTDTDVISDHSKPLKDRIAALKRMGAIR